MVKEGIFSHTGQAVLGCKGAPGSFSELRYSVIVLVLKLSRIVNVVTILEILRDGTNQT